MNEKFNELEGRIGDYVEMMKNAKVLTEEEWDKLNTDSKGVSPLLPLTVSLRTLGVWIDAR